MSAYPKQSIREVARRVKIPVETAHLKRNRLKRLLSMEYVKKYEKMGQFSS